MNLKHIKIIAAELNLSERQVENTINLLTEGATIPFISRYRKEVTGTLDEIQISDINTLSDKLAELEKRRESILSAIEKQGKLTDDLKNKIEATYDISELEDLYLPYKQKKKTRAIKAKEKGLEPLAKIIFIQNINDVESEALKYVNDEVETVKDALQGARDIIAEEINENKKARDAVRREFNYSATVKSTVVKTKKDEAVKFRDYFEFEESLKKIPSHRLLAVYRGVNEGFLRVKIHPNEDKVLEKLDRIFLKGDTEATDQVESAIDDAYKRLLLPSIENEFSNAAKEKADKEAIKVFADNLRQLLLAAPLGEKRILAIDPAFRTGCKTVCLDEHGNLLHNETIYPHPPQKETFQAGKKLASLVNAYNIEAIAIGNGTASRETEQLVRQKVRFDRELKVFVVSEDGASVYSASKIAREEFPTYDVTVRGAVSIGRRLADPLSELVKIDPKSIGVGQYQHDVNQKELQKSLDIVVESCVNAVGVDLNTAGKHLLNYVSGLGGQLAQNIVDYRTENGAFKSRKELKKVKRLGEKAYEQCAGFLRIRDAENPLDNTAVHPEAYHIVQKMAKDNGVSISDLIQSAQYRKKVNLKNYISDTIGLPTLTDIMKELEKPGRDPRQQAKVFEFSKDVFTVDDLRVGMILPGIITNITNFGAFVDVGVKQDGLVHISHLKNAYVSNPADVVKLHQHVQVKVISIDLIRKRIGLSMKEAE
ncbi:MAG: RNA-binding transcriptional accessory protein [Bacteroidales bacterium]|nr:RNA-binding transcriptional accessory protein [Bacteroidales bacterium]